MPLNTNRTRQVMPPLYLDHRHQQNGAPLQFYTIYFVSLFCLIATGWAAALFL